MSVTLAAARGLLAELARRLIYGGRARLVPVGSVRRGEARAADLDVLVVTSDAFAPPAVRPRRPGDRISGVALAQAGPRKHVYLLTLHNNTRIAVDAFRVRPPELPYALFHYTGSSQYNVRTRAFAKRRGWKLNQYGLFDAATGRRVRGSAGVRGERGLAALLGVTYRPPGDRQR